MVTETTKTAISKLQSVEDAKVILDYTIKQSRLALKNYPKEKYRIDSMFADMVCCSILGNNGIECDIIQFELGTIKHSVAVALLNINDSNKIYILDCIYDKFLIASYDIYKYLNLEAISTNKEIIEQLLNCGYFEYNENNMKKYFGIILTQMVKNKERRIIKKYVNDFKSNYFLNR